MARTAQCDGCGVVLHLPERWSGQRLKCPKCGHRIAAGRDVAVESAGDRGAAVELPVLSGAGAHAPSATREAGSALALFEEERPARRRPGAAAARAKARRCPTCGGFIPIGTSLCSTCGLDLETGRRVAPIDLAADLLPEAAPTRRRGTPIGVGIVGGLAGLGSLLLLLVSLWLWDGGVGGAEFLAPVGAFGIYASFRFLAGQSIKPLMLALTLGAALDVVALIALPIVAANIEPAIVRVEPSGEEIQPISERIDAERIGLGIVGLVFYALASAYLLSPSARSHLSASKSA